jgi:hypothetical protein
MVDLPPAYWKQFREWLEEAIRRSDEHLQHLMGGRVELREHRGGNDGIDVTAQTIEREKASLANLRKILAAIKEKGLA